MDNPVQAIPSQEKPIREKAVQLNTEEKKKKEKNTDISNPYQSNIHQLSGTIMRADGTADLRKRTDKAARHAEKALLKRIGAKG